MIGRYIGALFLALPLAAAADAQLEQGRAVYNYRCYFCHGYSGDAKTLAATYLTPPPANFRSAKPDHMDRNRILDAVRHGRPGTATRVFALRDPASRDRRRRRDPGGIAEPGAGASRLGPRPPPAKISGL